MSQPSLSNTQDPRLEIECPVRFSAYSIQGEGTVTRLSMNGWRITTEAVIPPGTPLRLSVSLPDNNDPLEVELATVVWSAPGELELNTIIMSLQSQSRLLKFLYDAAWWALLPIEFTVEAVRSLPPMLAPLPPIRQVQDLPSSAIDPTTIQKRQLKRHPTHTPIAYVWDLLDGGGQLIDLSTGGCRVRSDGTIQDPTYLRLILHPPHEQLPIKVELAAVRWAAGQEFGLEFIRMNGEHQKRLREWVNFLDMSPGAHLNSPNRPANPATTPPSKRPSPAGTRPGKKSWWGLPKAS